MPLDLKIIEATIGEALYQKLLDVKNLRVYLIKEVYKKGNYSIADATFYINSLSGHVGYFYSALTSFLNSCVQLLVYGSFLIFTDLNSNQKKLDLSQFLKKPLCIIVGPEGDFSESERQKILKFNGVQCLKLSDNILRSETAVISALSVINFVIN